MVLDCFLDIPSLALHLLLTDQGTRSADLVQTLFMWPGLYGLGTNCNNEGTLCNTLGTKCNGDIMNGDTKIQVGDTMLRVWGHNERGHNVTRPFISGSGGPSSRKK